MKNIYIIIKLLLFFTLFIAAHEWIGWVGSVIGCLATAFALRKEWSNFDWQRTHEYDKYFINTTSIQPIPGYVHVYETDTVVTREEFFLFVVPHVRLLNYWPEWFDQVTNKKLADFLWETIQAKQGWYAQQALFDAWAELNMDCMYIIKAIEQCFRSYRCFKTAKIYGYYNVYVSTSNHFCQQVKVEKLIPVKDMYKAYNFSSSRNNKFLVPYVGCPINGIDGGGLCDCSIRLGSLTKEEAYKDYDKEMDKFAREMRKILESNRK